MITNNIEDKISLLHVRAGRTEAFIKIYDRYSKEIYRYISFKVGTAQQAEDITSDVFVRALEYAADEERPMVQKARPFLYQVARAAIADHYRDRQPTGPLEAAEGIEGHSRDLAVTDVDNAELQRALLVLPDDQREAVLLKHMEDLSAREVGAIMGRSAGAVRVLVHRGLERLREVMGAGDAGVQNIEHRT